MCKSIIGDEIPPYKQAGAYGKLAAISGVGFIVGPVVGGHIIDYEHGFSFVTIIIMVCFLINIGMDVTVAPVFNISNWFVSCFNSNILSTAIVRILPISHHRKNRTSSDNLGIKAELYRVITHLKSMNWGKHKKVLFLKFIFVFTMSFYYNNYSVFLQEKYGMTSKYVGYIIAFQSLVGSATSLLSSQIQHLYEWWYPPQRASAVQIVHSFTAVAAALIGVSFTNTSMGLLLWLIPLASGAALLRILMVELLVQLSLPQERGSLLGVAHSFSALSRLCTPIIAGVASDIYGTQAVSFLSQVIAASGAFLAHYFLKGEYLQHYT